MTDFLKFIELPQTGRTQRFEVRSVHTDEVLGTVEEKHDGAIQWRNGWRHYVMHFDRDCDWSIECMAQCYKFVAKLMQDRKVVDVEMP